MKQYVKVSWSVIFAVLIVSAMAAVCVGYSVYDLGVKEGDWIEYDVVEAENYKFFVEVHSGDRLRFEVTGITVQERMYPNGTVAFEVEAPVCEIFLNGEHIRSNVTLSEMIFCPKGEEHWRSLDKIEDVWKIEASKYGSKYESNMTFGRDTVLFSYAMEGAVNGGAKQIIHKDTGIALEFGRYTYVGENRSEYRLVISDTNVSGVLAPGYITYWYLTVLVAVVVVIAFAVLLKYRQSKKEGGRGNDQ
ncbi:MAG: hypothetical protein KAT65_28735 [Methanophagales archaeon]|nr:hypothetical protein [Methanophagales archaeon]